MILYRLRQNRRTLLGRCLFDDKDRHWKLAVIVALVGLIAVNQLVGLSSSDLPVLHGLVSALASVSVIVVLALPREFGVSSASIALVVLTLYLAGLWLWPAPKDDVSVFSHLLFLGGVVALARLVVAGRSRTATDGANHQERTRWLLTLDQAEPRIHYEITRSRRYERPFSLILLEWSVVGATRSLAAFELRLEQLLQPSIRRIDFCFLLNGADRLVVICPETNAMACEACAHRLQSMLRHKLSLPVRCAVAAFPDHAVTFQGLLDHAALQLRASSRAPLAQHETGGTPEQTVKRLAGCRDGR